MSFTPSENFSKRWLDSPLAMKQAIFAELSDIMTLLQDETKLDTFSFTSEDLADKLTHLQTAHLQTLKRLAHQRKIERGEALLPILEAAIDDKLTEQMAILSDELKGWIRQAIKEELDKEQI